MIHRTIVIVAEHNGHDTLSVTGASPEFKVQHAQLLHFVVEDFGFSCGGSRNEVLVQYVQNFITDGLQLVLNLPSQIRTH